MDVRIEITTWLLLCDLSDNKETITDLITVAHHLSVMRNANM